MARVRRDVSLARLALYFDAVRGMRPRQIVWRLRRLVPPRLLAAGTGIRRPPQPRLVASGLGRSPAPQSGPTKPPHEAGVFAGYGTSREFGDPRFWDEPRDGLLFLFHLHGFSPLAEYAAGPRSPEGSAFWAQVVDSWLTAHDHPSKPAWHPYPTSVRLISWSAALSAIEEWPAELRDRIAAATLRQARYLRRAVEHDVGGNHVIKNATALIFSGVQFPNSHLLKTGLRLLRRELSLQVLDDGGHEERSTSYHREISTDLAQIRELLRRAGERVPDWLEDAAKRMRDWLAAVCGPDGVLPLLNDSWEGPPIAVDAKSGVINLDPTGYVVFRCAGDQLVFDAAPLCPRHLPPHAHADALSCLLWVDGLPLVIDGGSYAYSGEARDRFRSTAGHNTVEVDGQDQCEFWGSFRAAYLPTVQPPELLRNGELRLATSRHDGYGRLAVPAIHERTVAWWPGWGVVILDRLLGRGSHSVSSRLHCAPTAKPVSPHRLGPLELTTVGGRVPAVRDGLWSPFLGTALPTKVLEQRFDVAAGAVFGWSLLRPGARVVEASAEQLVVERPGHRIQGTSFLAPRT